MDLLFGHFDEGEEHLLRNAHTLAHNESFARKVIWLDGIDLLNWDCWKEFFGEFAQVNQYVPQEDRTVFCVLLTAELAKQALFSDQTWSQHLWRGVTSSLDMLMFTTMMLEDRPMPPLQKRVATSVIAQLAAWDPEVCEQLAIADMAEITNPAQILRKIAKQRDWKGDAQNSSFASWEKGMNEFVDRKLLTHSAILALENSLEELNRRIWTAEMSVLLPIVEDARQTIIEVYESQLKIPWPTAYGEIQELRDLEINHINSQIKRGSVSVDLETQQLVSELAEIRNRLAHLRIITADMLDSKVLNDFVRTKSEEMLPYLQEMDEPAEKLS